MQFARSHRRGQQVCFTHLSTQPERRAQHGERSVAGVCMGQADAVGGVVHHDAVTLDSHARQPAEAAILSRAKHLSVLRTSPALDIITLINHPRMGQRGKSHLAEVGVGIMVMGTSPLPYGDHLCRIALAVEQRLQMSGKAVATDGQRHSVDKERYIACLHTYRQFVLLMHPLLGEQTADIALRERFLRHLKQRQPVLVRGCEAHAIDSERSHTPALCFGEVQFHAHIAGSLHIVYILEGIAQAEVIGSQEYCRLVPTLDAEAGVDGEAEVGGCRQALGSGAYPLCSRPGRQAAVHQSGEESRLPGVLLSLVVPHAERPAIPRKRLQRLSLVGHSRRGGICHLSAVPHERIAMLGVKRQPIGFLTHARLVGLHGPTEHRFLFIHCLGFHCVLYPEPDQLGIGAGAHIHQQRSGCHHQF